MMAQFDKLTGERLDPETQANDWGVKARGLPNVRVIRGWDENIITEFDDHHALPAVHDEPQVFDTTEPAPASPTTTTAPEAASKPAQHRRGKKKGR